MPGALTPTEIGDAVIEGRPVEDALDQGGRCGAEVASAIGDTGAFRAPVRSGGRSS